jgi:hypothetical protein
MTAYITSRHKPNPRHLALPCEMSRCKYTDLDRLQKVQAHRIDRQSAHEGGKVASTAHWPPLVPVNIPSTHFCYRLCQPQSHIATGRITSIKISNDTIDNRTRDLPACGAVPQPVDIPCTPSIVAQYKCFLNYFQMYVHEIN